MITRITREAVAAARLYGSMYVHGERSLRHLPADAGLLLRDHKLQVLGATAEAIGVVVDLAFAAEMRVRDAWIRAGRAWEETLGMPERDRMFAYRIGGMHLSTEPCLGDCGHGAEPDDADVELD